VVGRLVIRINQADASARINLADTTGRRPLAETSEGRSRVGVWHGAPPVGYLVISEPQLLSLYTLRLKQNGNGKTAVWALPSIYTMLHVEVHVLHGW
jgi:hypothetical protein